MLLLGDGAAGFSLMDVDTLVRHGLPVVIVCGNNGIWGLEKHPMRMLYGYDVAADLQPQCRYDQVAEALGAAGELVTSPDELAPALRRAFDAGVPYLVNVATDPEVAYPRSTSLRPLGALQAGDPVAEQVVADLGGAAPGVGEDLVAGEAEDGVALSDQVTVAAALAHDLVELARTGPSPSISTTTRGRTRKSTR